MGIALCARLKKSRQSRSSLPSDISTTYQLSRTESPQDGGVSESTPSSIGSPPSPTLPKCPLSEGQALSLSGRLRRRFSCDNRKTKSIHLPLRRSADKERQNGVSIFSLSSRFSRLGPFSAVPGSGGSLTSERGYDSDAQYISSPRNMTLCRSPVPPAREFSPLQVGHGYARTELSDLSERSNERLGDGFGDVVEQSDGLVTTVQDDLGVLSEREGALAMDGADTKSVDQGTSEAIVQEAVVEDVSQPIQSEIRDSAASNESVEGVQITDIVSEPRSSTPVESDERDSHCHAALPSRRDQRIASWGCDAGTDSKPVYSWRKHGSEIMVPKKRQQPTRSPSECNSLHLGDMNIPHALASPSLMSPSITPRLLSQNQLIDENRRDSVLGSRSVSDSSAVARRESSQHQREVSSSFYSPRSGSSSAPSGNPPPSNWGHSGIEKYLHKLDRQAGSRSLGFDGPGSYPRARFSEASESSAAESSNAATIEVLRNRYIDGFEKDAAVDGVGTAEMGGAQPPARQVSAGWMSGGRRIGYGYSMVTPNEKENIGSQVGGSRSTSAAAYGSSVSVNTIPSMISRLSQRQLSGTAASLKVPVPKEPTDADSFSSPIWARVANRMKSRNGSAFNSTRTMPGHWPVSGSEHGSGRQRSPPKRMSILENKDGGLLRRMTRIYSVSSLQTRRRNATENMHDIKERVSAKASGIYQPLSQRKESGDFRLRALSRGKGRVDDGTAGFSPLKNCGWTRADRSANWLARPDVTTGSERKTSEQIGSDDTTEELVYQDCLEDIPA